LSVIQKTNPYPTTPNAKMVLARSYVTHALVEDLGGDHSSLVSGPAPDFGSSSCPLVGSGGVDDPLAELTEFSKLGWVIEDLYLTFPPSHLPG
jgi:hypothetical protein